MRYKRGCKVEVFRKHDPPLGSWQGAEVISGNGHTYTVRYDAGSTDEAVVERVSRKFLRTTPPTLEVLENWVSGDMVEVFDNFCWKMAIILKAFKGDYFLVRLVGSTWELKVSKVYIRARLFWEDDKWFMIGKASRSCGEVNQTEQSTLKFHQNINTDFLTTSAKVNPLIGEDCSAVKGTMDARKIKNSSPGTLKRKFSFHDLPTDACTEAIRKLRFTRREEIQKHTPLNDGTTGFSELDIDRSKFDVFLRSSLPISFHDGDGASCSVGSCSVSSNVHCKLPRRSTVNTDDNFSDAESFCKRRDEGEDESLPTNEELAEEIHSLELHAYHCTLAALYVSGPLSWEQEGLLTNLRMLLHISNDEHLMEVRNLISADSAIRIA